MRPSMAALDHLVLTVADLDATLAFYGDVLGMCAQTFRAADGSMRHALSFGAQKINLHPARAPYHPHAARPAPGSGDLCFLTDTPLADWQAHLASLGVEVLEGPVARSGATGAITSLYIRGPDGNLIEIAHPVP